MKIAFTGEGATDYGKQHYNKKTGEYEWEWGPAAVYLEKIAKENDVDIELVVIQRADIEKHKLQGRSLKGLSGKAIPARKFADLMRREKCTYGVYYCDADRECGQSNSDRSGTEKWYGKRYEEVQKGLNASAYEKIPMIPLRMIESWILGDLHAIELMYNKK